jgi:hypothetical protein
MVVNGEEGRSDRGANVFCLCLSVSCGSGPEMGKRHRVG